MLEIIINKFITSITSLTIDPERQAYLALNQPWKIFIGFNEVVKSSTIEAWEELSNTKQWNHKYISFDAAEALS